LLPSPPHKVVPILLVLLISVIVLMISVVLALA
jgi:hypothetical protein